LGIARGTLYLKGKQAVKDKKVATAIEEWHEQDDTRSPSQTGGPAQDGEKPRQARDEEKWDRSSSQKEAVCLSRQGEQYCPQYPA